VIEDQTKAIKLKLQKKIPPMIKIYLPERLASPPTYANFNTIPYSTQQHVSGI